MSISERIEGLLNRMTLREKAAQMDMIRGVPLATKVHPAHFCAVQDDSDFHWNRVEARLGDRGIGFVHDVYGSPAVINKLQRYLVEKTRLGIPAIITGESLHGLSCPGAMSFPMPINWGTTFDPELVRDIGRAIGAECRALGVHEILAPNLDVARDPRWGRVEETFGEDTYLCSVLGKALIEGEQGSSLDRPDTVVCEPKHYLAHGFAEGGINCAAARCGEREVLSEYLPVFEAGIKDAGAWCAMAAYHSMDGQPLISHHHYLTHVLKEQLGLKGYVRSDFGAVGRLIYMHRTAENAEQAIEQAVNAGLDVTGFDFSNDVWQNAIVHLVETGRIPQERIDDAVRRVLRVKFELGLFEHPYTDETHHRQVVRCEDHRQLCLKAAQESTVLLKNDGILPLNVPENAVVAVIGPSSNRQRLGSYASVPYGYHVSSVYEELLHDLAGHAKVVQADGCSISDKDCVTVPAKWLPNGVTLRFYANGADTSGLVGESQTDYVNFNWMLAKPHDMLPFNGYGVEITGEILPDEDVDGTVILPCSDSVRLYWDDELLLESWGDNKVAVPSAPCTFRRGEKHRFRIVYWNDESGKNMVFGYAARNEHSMDDAVALATEADLVILVCGDNTVTSGEGMDRDSLQLYGEQKRLVERISTLGKPTVLVLEAGKPVDLTDEESLMNAIVLPWFGGEMGAKAIVDVLMGRCDPSGRLPISFPRNVGALPCYYTRLPGGNADYLEGSTAARYPFGYGLSYTTFTLTDASLEQMDNGRVKVACTVTNAGERDGVAVLQAYVSDPVSSVVTPEKKLGAFQRVALKRGESRQVTLVLEESAFSLINARHERVVEPGRFVVQLGFDSMDIRARLDMVR